MPMHDITPAEFELIERLRNAKPYFIVDVQRGDKDWTVFLGEDGTAPACGQGTSFNEAWAKRAAASERAKAEWARNRQHVARPLSSRERVSLFLKSKLTMPDLVTFWTLFDGGEDNDTEFLKDKLAADDYDHAMDLILSLLADAKASTKKHGSHPG
jgi:hypothetical protein